MLLKVAAALHALAAVALYAILIGTLQLVWLVVVVGHVVRHVFETAFFLLNT